MYDGRWDDWIIDIKRANHSAETENRQLVCHYQTQRAWRPHNLILLIMCNVNIYGGRRQVNGILLAFTTNYIIVISCFYAIFTVFEALEIGKMIL